MGGEGGGGRGFVGRKDGGKQLEGERGKGPCGWYTTTTQTRASWAFKSSLIEEVE